MSKYRKGMPGVPEKIDGDGSGYALDAMGIAINEMTKALSTVQLN